MTLAHLTRTPGSGEPGGKFIYLRGRVLRLIVTQISFQFAKCFCISFLKNAPLGGRYGRLYFKTEELRRS